MSRPAIRVATAALCVAAALAWAFPAIASTTVDPQVFYASWDVEGMSRSTYPPPGGFEGPCGVAVDSSGNLYVSDYYRKAVDVFSGSTLDYLVQRAEVEPEDGPCALALGPSGRLYVNNFHRSVTMYVPSVFPPTGKTNFGSPTQIDSGRSTGVAVSLGTGDVYVDDGSRVAVYDSSGAPREVEGAPLQIGEGSLGEGFGVAVSDFPGTAGDVYVPDAATNTVKVYDPAVDSEVPAGEIDGHETPTGGFVSLRDAAVAIERETGTVYVTDDLQPAYFANPEAAVYAFEPDGTYMGRLKFNVIDARPPGLAVDNSTAPTRGRVYVTSGNTAGAVVNIYPRGAASKSAPVCAPGGPCPALPPAGAGSTAAAPPADPAPPAVKSALAPAVVTPPLAIAHRSHKRHRLRCRHHRHAHRHCRRRRTVQ